MPGAIAENPLATGHNLVVRLDEDRLEIEIVPARMTAVHDGEGDE